MDRNWNEEETPATHEFAVVVPWYKETRSVIIASIGLLAALFFASVAVNRHRRLLRSYAEVEKIVEQRTRELEQANQQLVHSQKMKALGTLAAGIAHDFNSILSIVKGSVQIIERNLDDPDKVRKRIHRIRTVVDQGTTVVRAMLGFSRASAPAATPCDLADLVNGTVQLMGERFLQDLTVRVLPSGPLSPVSGSRELIQQILMNLLLNAADAMAGGGELVIRFGELSRVPATAVLAPAPAPRYAFLAVQDTGSGIAPEILPRIFEPFFTTKAFSTRHGTGLGLSMVYEFAKEMGYGLHVDSEIGRGTTFMVMLPIVEAEAPAH